MITKQDLCTLINAMGTQAAADITWAEGLQAPTNADDFAFEAIFVICNSGMRFRVAAEIFQRCRTALEAGRPVREVFGHAGKAAAIETIWRDRATLLQQFLAAEDRLAFLAALPWIGDITKYHLAKNFGLDVAKPDVHLQRLADREGCSAQALCERLARETGFRVATVDTLLWRACALGYLNSRTGTIPVPQTEETV